MHELFYLPLIHIIPTKVENLSLLVSPLAISFYLLIISFKNLKDIRSYIFLITTIYVLLFFAGKSPSRFFIDIYFLSTYLLIYKIKYFIDKSYFKYIYKFSVIYFLFFITALIYSIVSFTPGSFSSAQYSKYMNKNAFLYSESEWINQNINIDSKIIYDRDIMRIKILQKNIFYYYDFSFYKEENIKDIIQNNYNYIVISEKNFKKYLKNNFYCDQSLIKKKNSYVKTRNPLNKKPFELIYLFKLECLEF